MFLVKKFLMQAENFLASLKISRTLFVNFTSELLKMLQT